MDKPSYKDTFKMYNFYATIFRSLTDPTDTQAKKLAEHYQDESIVNDFEEKVVKTYLKDGVSRITLPYTTELFGYEFRLYLIEGEKLLEQYKVMRVNTILLNCVFSEYKDKFIIIADKNYFMMKEMYNNISDKIEALMFYRSLFREILYNSAITPLNGTSIWLYEILSAMFLLQITGNNISSKDISEFGIEEEYFRIAKGIIDKYLNDLPVVPGINQTESVQKKIANKIIEEMQLTSLEINERRTEMN